MASLCTFAQIDGHLVQATRVMMGLLTVGCHRDTRGMGTTATSVFLHFLLVVVYCVMAYR